MSDSDSITAVPSRTCTRCQRDFPATPEHFYRQKLGKFGLQSTCRVCTEDVRRISRDARRPPREYELTGEIWKDVPGYEGHYQASDLGRVRRVGGSYGTCHPRLRKLSVHQQGYLVVTLYRDNCGRSFLVHRLVFAAFSGPIPDDTDINHIDGNKKNNTPGNLELASRRENIHHAIAIGLMNTTGENNPQARVTEAQVADMRARYRFGGGPGYKALAKEYGLPWGTVRNIITRKTWAHVA